MKEGFVFVGTVVMGFATIAPLAASAPQAECGGYTLSTAYACRELPARPPEGDEPDLPIYLAGNAAVSGVGVLILGSTSTMPSRI